jgi:hypothetical protein
MPFSEGSHRTAHETQIVSCKKQFWQVLLRTKGPFAFLHGQGHELPEAGVVPAAAEGQKPTNIVARRPVPGLLVTEQAGHGL